MAGQSSYEEQIVSVIGSNPEQEISRLNSLLEETEKHIISINKMADGMGGFKGFQDAVTNQAKLVELQKEANKALNDQRELKKKASEEEKKYRDLWKQLLKERDAEEKRAVAESIADAKRDAKEFEAARKKSIAEVQRAEKQAAADAKKDAAETAAAQKQAAREAELSAKAANDASNEYKQLSLAYNELALKAKNYYLTLGANHPTTVAAITDAKALSDRLKALDASVGQHTRNVGNYSSATQGLHFSIQQIARELPSLSNGMATFFSAIGNNIAPAADAFKRFREEQALLRAEGKPTQSVVQALAGSVFNLQTGLLLAVTAMTVYGKQIVEYIFQTEKAAEATSSLNRYVDELGDGLEENNKRLSSTTQLAVAQAKARGASAKEILAIEQKGYDERLKEQEGFIEASIDNETHYANVLSRIQGGIDVKDTNGKSITELQAKEQLEKARTQTIILGQQKQDIQNQKEINKLNAEAEELEELKRKKVKDLTGEYRKLRDIIQEVTNLLKTPDRGELDAITKEIDEQLKIASGSIEIGVFDKNAEEKAKAAAKSLLAILSAHQEDKLRNEKDYQEKRQKLIAKSERTIQTISQIGLEINRLNEAIAQRRINQIDAEIEAINRKRDAEIEGIEKSGASAIEKEEKITAAKAKAAAKVEQLEAERRRAQRRAAEFEKAITIGQIIAQTALAVVKSLPNVPLALGVAALGAAQLAAAIATPIPQFADGIEDSGERTLAWVGDGGRQEVIETRSGQRYITPSVPTLVDLPAHSRVHKSVADYVERAQGLTMGGMGVLKRVNEAPAISTKETERLLKRVAVGIDRLNGKDPVVIRQDMNSAYYKMIKH